MSRTYNTRPHWVKLNDPKFPTIERHQHYKIHTEYTGEQRPSLWNPKYMVRDYYQWVENIPCTIDMPEVINQHWKFNKTKLCDKRELIWSCPCCSKKQYKCLTNRAVRAKIKQKLHQATVDYGRSCDTDLFSSIQVPNGFDDYGTIWESTELPNWWDVDIQVDSKYDKSYWWD